MRRIFQSYFIKVVFNRWYVFLALLVWVWVIRGIWRLKNQDIDLKLLMCTAAAFSMILIFVGLLNVVSDIVIWIKTKAIKPLCPECFSRISINFICKCPAKVAVSPIVYVTKGLFLNRCPECSQKFFSRYSVKGELRGICRSCGSVIDDWQFYILHRSRIFITIEESLDKKTFENPPETWEPGFLYKKLKGCEHYLRKQDNYVQHWFRWDSNIDPISIAQNITENIDNIWIDKECASAHWQKTSVLLNHIRRNLKKIKFAFMGNADELRLGNLGIKEDKATFSISRENFLDQ